LTRGDAVVVTGALLTAVLIWTGFFVVPRQGGTLAAVIRVDGKEIARLPVTGDALAEKQVSLRGGVATVEFGQGKVRILPLSDHICPNGICWKTGWISRNGQSIVCVPNHMTITLEGPGPGVDSVVR
jgi:hypothetical protein